MEEQNNAVPIVSDNNDKIENEPLFQNKSDLQDENDDIKSLQNRIAFVPKFDKQADSPEAPEDVNLKRIPVSLKNITISPTYFVNSEKDESVSIIINGQNCRFTRFIDQSRAFDKAYTYFYFNTENRYFYFKVLWHHILTF